MADTAGKQSWSGTPAIRVDIVACARCHQNHSQLEFKKLKASAGEMTHWASCPTTSEPVLLKIVSE